MVFTPVIHVITWITVVITMAVCGSLVAGQSVWARAWNAASLSVTQKAPLQLQYEPCGA